MATRIDLVEDVLPISELRLRAAQQISKIQETQRPLVITQYGKAVAVLMEVAQFQKWQDRLNHLERHTREIEKELAELKLAQQTSEPKQPPSSSSTATDSTSEEKVADTTVAATPTME